MKVGIAGPVALEPLLSWLPAGISLPPVYSFPLIGRLAAGLLSRGHTVTVFAGSEKVARTEKWQGSNLEIVICPRRPARNAYDFYRFERQRLETAMRESGVDLIHAHWTYEFAAAALQTCMKTLITVHDCPSKVASFYKFSTAYPHWLFRSILGSKVIRAAPCLSCVSPYIRKSIRKLANSASDNRVIPNGIQESLFSMGQNRLEKPASSAAPKIATVLEGFGKRKNAVCAIRAFSHFRRFYPNAELWMFGTDFESGGLANQWSKARNLEKNVHFLGRMDQPQLHQALAESASVFLHPALEESFGMAIAEAMALGIPVVAGKASGSVPATLDLGRAGFLVDVENPQEVAQQIQAVLADPANTKATCKRAWRYAHENFREQVMIDRYIEYYQNILSKTQAHEQ